MHDRQFLLSTVRGIGIEVIGIPIDFPDLRKRGEYQKTLYIVKSDLFCKNKSVARYLTNRFVVVFVSNREFIVATHVCDIINSNEEYQEYFNKYIEEYNQVYTFLNSHKNLFKTCRYSKYINAGEILARRHDGIGFDRSSLDALTKIKIFEGASYEIVEKNNRIFISNKKIPTHWLQVNGKLIEIQYSSIDEATKAVHLLSLVGITDVKVVTE